jgi:type III restriction enzyme
VDKQDEAVEWIISVAMLTEGWDVKNVLQIVPMEEKAFNSKLLIAQVLGRGLRIPDGYPNAEVTVFNHDKWSAKIKDLVEEILEMETKIKNSPLTVGERAKYHFTLYNIDYSKTAIEKEIEKDTEVFNYKDYIKFSAETFEHKTETRFVKFNDKEYSIQYEIEKEKFLINDIVDKIHEEFRVRKLEGITLKLDEKEYTSNNLPDKKTIEAVIRKSMKEVGLEDSDYLGKKNRQAVFSSFNTLLRKKPKSLQLVRTPNSEFEVKTEDRESESVSVLGLKNGSSIFYSDNYVNEIVLEDSLSAFDEIRKDESWSRITIPDSINPFLFKTPIDLVFTTREPERKFVSELVKQENAKHITSWLKSKNQSFYSIEYSYTKGTHTNSHLFNPDFFILIRQDDFEYISVVEIKSDDDNSDENIQKNKYAIEHFNELNKRLSEKGIKQKYFFNFLSPQNFNDYFAYMRDGRLVQNLYKSELDVDLSNKEE